MTPARLAALLDAYGARPERWPDAERPAALALLARSPEARAQLADAGALDDLLDAAPLPTPAPDLATRVLATAPRRRRATARPAHHRRHSLVTAVVTLAAAAGLAVWLVRTAPAPTPLPPETVAALDDFEVPTDDLLSSADLGLAYEMPAFGCDDPTMGCDDLEDAPARESRDGAHAKEIPV